MNQSKEREENTSKKAMLQDSKVELESSVIPSSSEGVFAVVDQKHKIAEFQKSKPKQGSWGA